MNSVQLNARRALEEKVLLALISAFDVACDLDTPPDKLDEKAIQYLRELGLSDEEISFAKQVIARFRALEL